MDKLLILEKKITAQEGKAFGLLQEDAADQSKLQGHGIASINDINDSEHESSHSIGYGR